MFSSRMSQFGRSSARFSSRSTVARRLLHSETASASVRRPLLLGTAAAAAAFLVGSAAAVATVKTQSSEINCEGGSSWFNFFGGGNMRNQMEAHVRKTQSDIVRAIEELEGPDGGRFKRDSWTRKEGGEGMTCVLQDGKVFQKAGVAVSVIHSIAPEGMLNQMRAKKNPNLGDGPFKMFAAGVSLVMHPHNPNAPTVHMNYRYFELYPADGSSKKPVLWWFGGGSDLTPSYLFEEDAEHFHKTIKEACDKHDPEYYPKFKKWCDEYFNNTHRGDERRGIGGIFFDDLADREPEKIFAFVQDCSQAFLKQYIPIMQKRKDMPFTEEMTRWQQIRRGRYVEFNLVHDRGTKFGLATPSARIESIFLSLPLTARWEYMHAPLPGSEEFKLVEVLKKPREWA